MNLNYIKTNILSKTPTYGTQGSACFDLYSIEGGVVESRNSRVFEIGLKFEVPQGYVMMIYSRSGHGFKDDVRLANCVGVIDSDYRGEVKVKLTNDGAKNFTVHVGDRIAQAMLIPYDMTTFTEFETLEQTIRGERGFGSTDNADQTELFMNPALINTRLQRLHQAELLVNSALLNSGIKLGGSRYFHKKAPHLIKLSPTTDYDLYCGEAQIPYLTKLGFVGHPNPIEFNYKDNDAIDIWLHPDHANIQVVVRKDPIMYSEALSIIAPEFFYNYIWKSSPACKDNPPTKDQIKAIMESMFEIVRNKGSHG